MQKAALGFWLAGAAAAAVVLAGARAPSAAPLMPALSLESRNCTWARQAGEAVKWTSRLIVRGSITDRAAVRRGNRIKTTARGKAQLCVRVGQWRCTVYGGTELRVLPKANTPISLVTGELDCSSRARAKTQIITTPQGSLTVNGRLVPASREPAARARPEAAQGGILMSIRVRRGRTTLRLWRGTVLVGAGKTARAQLAVGKNEESSVRSGSAPQPPRPIERTKAESQRLAALERLLPPVRDRRAPAVELRGPRPRSSVRTTPFRFTADEPAVFACAIDGRDFRLCTTPHVVDVAPGAHTFTVRATDSAGNTRTTTLTWSVDDSQIAFGSGRAPDRKLYRVDPDGTNLTQLTTGRVSDENPDWSPDRRRIAFDGFDGENRDIYVINADRTGETQLTDDPAVDQNPSWSPDGTRIAFESFRDGNREIYVMNSNGTDVRRLTTDPAEDRDPAWSPDGTRIAFASSRRGDFDLYVMNRDGTSQLPLTSDDPDDFGPSWSPDGAKIAFHSDRSGAAPNIFVINADGSALQQVTQIHQADNPSWAPDGWHIAFRGSRAAMVEPQLLVVDLDTTDIADVTRDRQDVRAPDW